tara:strand:- start:340 stop:546 length:207 start_codon:yes stop_codon:yes gene_type:complete
MNEMKLTVTEAFGDLELIKQLAERAITMMSATGSLGTTYTHDKWDIATGEIKTLASVSVARTDEGQRA